MRDTIKLIAKQIHAMLPEHRIAITRFNAEYKYGQLYLGELDRSITRDLMRRTFARRNFAIVFSQNPATDQAEAREEFETVCRKIEDCALQQTFPIWHKLFFDVYETTLVVSFQVWERYEYKTDPEPVMEELDTDLPYVYYDWEEPEEPEEPEDQDLTNG